MRGIRVERKTGGHYRNTVRSYMNVYVKVKIFKKAQ